MKKLVLAISLVIASSVNVFSQKTDFDKFGLNNKVVNYILKGEYQKVINITKTSYFRLNTIRDTNSNGGFFDKQNPISDQDLIGYLSRIRDIVNTSNIESAIQNPNGITIEVNNWSMTEDYFRGTPRENEMKTYATRTYILTKGNYTIYFILAFQNSKLDGLGIHFRMNAVD
jgi:hypothetical protein